MLGKLYKLALQDCIFLKDKLCTIYPVRPLQCSTYPWWPSLMDPISWGIEGAEVCEGFDHEDADPVDMPHASGQLLKSAEYFSRMPPPVADGALEDTEQGSK